MSGHPVWRWVLIALVVVAIVLLIGYVRGDDGDDGRSPELDAAPIANVLAVSLTTRG